MIARAGIREVALLAVFASSACATTPPPPPPSETNYRHALSPLDVTGATDLPRHRYAFKLAAGRRVRIWANAFHMKLTMSVFREHRGQKVLVETATMPHEDGNMSAIVTVEDAADTWWIEFEPTKRDFGTYVFSLNPGPTRELEHPAHSLEVAERANQEFYDAARAERRRRENENDIDTRMVDQKRETECKGKNRVFLTLPLPNGEVHYFFCDRASVKKLPDGRMEVDPGLAGDDYEAFMAREREAFEVAQHNYEVLKSTTWLNRRNRAQADYDARVQQFIKKYRWSDAKYIQAAKATRVTTASR